MRLMQYSGMLFLTLFIFVVQEVGILPGFAIDNTSPEKELLEKVQLPVPDIWVKEGECNQFTFDGTSSYDLDNPSLDYQWDFDDGETSKGSVVTHTFKRAGKYDVSLWVTDQGNQECAPAHAVQMIKVNIPPQAEFHAPAPVCVQKEISLEANLINAQKGSKISYTWDFGDSTLASGKMVKKTFKEGGNYEVALVTDDNRGNRCSSSRVEKTFHINEPPKAVAGKDITRTCITDDDDMTVTFDASESRDFNDDPLTYIWDFGDGEMGEGISVDHTYKKNGRFEVVLTVKDNSSLGCNSDTDKMIVVLSRAPRARAGRDIAVCKGQTVDFNGSASFKDDGETLFARWDFGDGASQRGVNGQHTYNRIGKYPVTLTVQDAFSKKCPISVDQLQVTVNSKPSVSLKPVGMKCAGEDIAFDATRSGDPDGNRLEYVWDFGDGTVLKAGPEAYHKYESGGNYRVRVTVDDGQRSDCSSVSDSIQVKVNSPPVADAGPDTACCAGQFSLYDGSGSYDADGDPLLYYWRFGDGTISRKELVTHSYEQEGTYKVILTVDDQTGTSCSKTSAEYMSFIEKFY